MKPGEPEILPHPMMASTESLADGRTQYTAEQPAGFHEPNFPPYPLGYFKPVVTGGLHGVEKRLWGSERPVS